MNYTPGQKVTIVSNPPGVTRSELVGETGTIVKVLLTGQMQLIVKLDDGAQFYMDYENVKPLDK